MTAGTMSRFGLLFLALLLVGCGSKDEKKPTGVDQQPTEDIRARTEAIELTQPDKDGKPMFKIKASASLGSASNGDGEVEFEEVEAVLYRDGQPTMEIKADKATYDSKQKLLRTVGGVSARSSVNDASIQADRIDWRPDKDRLEATGNVKVIWRQMELTDHKIYADTAANEIWTAP